MIVLFILLLCTHVSYASVATEYAYSKACASGQAGDWRDAQENMCNLIIDTPDRPELLYDTGVAAYRLQEFDKAKAYFDQTTKNNVSSDQLKKQAYFNLGNTEVALNNLQDAVNAYESVLKIDKDDEHTKHNLEKVRELLAQQQQQQQGDDKDQQQEQQQQSGDSNKQNQDQNNNDQKQDNDSGNQDESGSQGQNNESNNDDKGDQKDQSNEKSASNDQRQEQDQFGDGHESSPQDRNNEQLAQSNKNDKPDEPQGHNTASTQKKPDEKLQDPERDMMAGIDDSELDKDKRQEDQKKLQQQFAPHEQWMARLLQRREKADEQANKQLIKATVDKNTAGQYGQNNW